MNIQTASIMTATQVNARNHSTSPHLIPPPSGDFTHSGVWQGPGTPGLSKGREYNLIYDSVSNSVAFANDHGSWMSCDGDMFRVTHDYGMPTRYSTNDAFADDDTSLADMPAPPGGGQTAAPCDMTGITITNADDMYTPEQLEEMGTFDDSIPFNEDGDPCIAPGPESTEALREYRFKPNLF